MLESAVLDFRCSSCGMIRRVDAMLACSVVSHLPSDWAVADGGTLVCAACLGPPAPAVHEVNTAAVPEEEIEAGYKKLAEDPDQQRRQRADKNRDKASSLHAGREEDNPFESRRRPGESLNPPTTTAGIPTLPDLCGDCGKKIGEHEARRPDPVSELFVWVHRDCLRARSQG